MKNKKYYLIISALLVTMTTSVLMMGCSTDANTLKDGYYTAEDNVGSNGWYEFVTIYVKNNSITSVEYNAKDSSGFIKAWDMNYMRLMNAQRGTYPNDYTRSYASDFLEAQSTDGVDAITGATHSFHTFVQLANAALTKAKAGDKTVALVDVKHDE